ncbi:MAG: hypothetical protein A3J96_00255 [Sulfurimonas sp. RIFOXYC2_FULL_36_7]|nr:MAG: hypothetical protein A2229_02585 [Candidatus Peregrinibacteria bacterium RIFOXYA2_FULL_33_7]OHE12259.1 MAG: hypothetical protein A3J96_00255 [Sulfurimonas sp. RIFOXYC2_FULL_36_7]
MPNIKNPDEDQPINEQETQQQALSNFQQTSKTGQENIEKEPELKLINAGPCSSPGQFIGLSKAQREILGVQPGESVLLYDNNNEPIGEFTVGMGSKQFLKERTKFTANLTPKFSNQEITIRKKTENQKEAPQEWEFSIGVETNEKNPQRQKIIATRFKDMDPQSYVVIPTPLAKSLNFPSANNPEKPNLLQISKFKIRTHSNQTIEMIGVPAGQKLEFTTKAAQITGIKELKDLSKELNSLKVRVEDNTLIIS